MAGGPWSMAFPYRVYAGKCVGAPGPNGAGETTVLRMLLGAAPPDGGTLKVLGWPIPRRPRKARAGPGGTGLLPLAHAVALVRPLTAGGRGPRPLLHTAVLAAYGVAVFLCPAGVSPSFAPLKPTGTSAAPILPCVPRPASVKSAVSVNRTGKGEIDEDL